MAKRRRARKGEFPVAAALGQLRSVVREINELVGDNARTLSNTVAEVGRLGNIVAASAAHRVDKCAKVDAPKSMGGETRVNQDPPVLIELDRQQRALELLNERLSALGEKLDPALIPMPPPATTAQPTGVAPMSAAGMSRIANMICSRTDLLEHAVARVQRLIERVEV